jgi:hypothetical protein
MSSEFAEQKMDNFLKNITDAVDHWTDKETQPDRDMETFFGKPGEVVPEVDPDDLKAVAAMYAEAEKRHPGGQIAITERLLATVCKPGANVRAVSCRYGFVAILALMAAHLPESPDPEMAEFIEKLPAIVKDGALTGAALNAAATIPMTWQTKGLPYDFDELLRMCA